MLASIAFPPTPAAAAQNIHAHTFNMAMEDSAYGNYQQTVDLVVYFAVAGNPWIIALQEVCNAQMSDLTIALQANGLSVAPAYKQTTSGATQCPNGGSAGTAVFGIGTSAGSDIFHETAPKVGKRWIACQKTSRSGLLFTACSGHLNSSRPTAADQLSEAFVWWQATHTTPWMFGGDFNQEYGEPDPTGGQQPTAQWWYTHEEIHLPSQPLTYNPTEDKIDYVFADRGAFDDGPYQTCYSSSNSDHRYCDGYFVR